MKCSGLQIVKNKKVAVKYEKKVIVLNKYYNILFLRGM